MKLNIIGEDDIVKFCKMVVLFFRIIYSILDFYGIVVKMLSGNIVYIGDFKFDFILVGELVNLMKMVEIGKEGVLCFFLDSINSENLEFIMFECCVGESIYDIFCKVDG